MNTIRTEKLDTRNFIITGTFAAIGPVTSSVIGRAAGMMLIGAVTNIPITAFFTSIACMLFASKVKKRRTSLITGTINTLPGLMAVNVIGVIVSVVGWLMAEIVVGVSHYKNEKVLILVCVPDCTLHSVGYTFPIYLSNAQYLIDRQEIPYLIDEAFTVHLRMFTWLIFSIMVVLTTVTNFLGAVFSARISKKHLEKVRLL